MLKEEMRTSREAYLREKREKLEINRVRKVDQFHRRVLVHYATTGIATFPLSKDEAVAKEQLRMLYGMNYTTRDITQRVTWYERLLGIEEKECIKTDQNIQSLHRFYYDGEPYRIAYGCRTWVTVTEESI
jgi:hypothetical protein